ncbi:MAG: small multi-drug export protein [Dehalococcoides mccartyi]|uniref:COG2426 family protein n=1 Tax=Dehalococcoides TaxID=61434 RepID=UPI00059E7D1B|nr:small multi-drug export protein [Dehalococcoides mccartyi]MBF4482859.1 small multi-drug export protein [Dehalococcoides mccartyi]MBJ7532141.1 small multi-drug export protein [Dehalococcoides mccartyi]MDP4280071.1 small multi-drug export protein [Dehalococcoides mccartyi]
MSSEFWLSLGLPPELLVFLVSAVPVSELRGALPLAINVLGIPWYWAYLIALAGNLLPVPFILFLLEKVLALIGHFAFIRKFTDWIVDLGKKRSAPVERYKRIGLLLLVAVPLPFTGAWTGSLVAVVLGLDRKEALIYISLGVVVAGVVVTCLCLLGWFGALIAGLVLSGVAVFRMMNSRKPPCLT